ncbi:MAG TPA: hypothetical protein VFL80_05065 [Thermoanaerobaculia bacterium]|nr:hypothetical protein [Thermoanaerobaculia bacterium]
MLGPTLNSDGGGNADVSAAIGIVGDGSDGRGTYANGSVERLECSFSVNRGVVNFVTYQTPRQLRFNLESVATLLRADGANVQNSFLANVDLFGINYFGKFENMQEGSTARIQADLEFYVGRTTYELDYANIAVKRLPGNTWLFTTDSADIGTPCIGTDFCISDEATLNVIRRKSQNTLGVVHAPIRFTVTLN